MLTTNHISLGWHLSVVKDDRIPGHTIIVNDAIGNGVSDYVAKIFIKRRKTDAEADAYKVLLDGNGLKKTAQSFSIDTSANYRAGSYYWYIQVYVQNQWKFTFYAGEFDVRLPGTFSNCSSRAAKILVVTVDTTTGEVTFSFDNTFDNTFE